MKAFVRYILLVIILLSLVACAASTPEPVAALGGASTPAPDSAAYLNTDYPDAINLRNQLAFGSLKLEGTKHEITPEQAKTLLPLWQAMIALIGDDSTAEEELTALQNQITEAMAIEQLKAIADMQITDVELNVFYAEHGITFPTPEPGVTKVPGSMKDLPTEDKEATRAANETLGTTAGTGSGTGQAARTLLFDSVVELLTVGASQ